MPSFLCCSLSIEAYPISPEERVSSGRSTREKVFVDSRSDVYNDSSLAAKDAYKLQTLLDVALLPGQLPESRRDAASGRSCNPDKKGVPLLEDALRNSTNARSYKPPSGNFENALQPRSGEKSPSAASVRLTVPAHLQGSSATFSADYRDSEQVIAPASFRTLPSIRTPSTRSRELSSTRLRPHASNLQSPSLESLVLMADPPFLRSVSRKSGQRRLYRHFQMTDPDPIGTSVTGGSSSGAALALDAPASGAPPAAGASVGLSTCAIRQAALRQLQQELDTAEALPCCPLLLLPHRVYEQPDAVHVVYDSAGEYGDLHTFLRAQQRLPEGACRSVMRQLLQALSVLHERRWVHRNISTETVWVVEARPRMAPGEPHASTPSQPLPQTQGQAPVLPFHGAVQEVSLDVVEAFDESPTSPRPQSPIVAPASAVTGQPHRHYAVAPAAASAMPSTQPSESKGGGGGYGGTFQGSATSSSSGGSHLSGGWMPATDDPQAAHGRAPEPATRLPVPPPASPQKSTLQESTSFDGGIGCMRSSRSPQRKGQQQQQQQQIHVKLGGLALAVRPQEDPGTGQELPLRELVGCAYHLAPEAISGVGYGRPADVWAAGVLLYMLLTCRPPFPGRNELEVMARVLLAASTPEPSRQGQAATAPAAAPAGPSHGQTGLREAISEPAACHSQLLPGQPHSPELLSLQTGVAASARRRASAGDCASCQPIDSGGPCGSGEGAAFQRGQQRSHPLRELVVQAVMEARASAACREVLAGMLVAEPEGRLTAAELLRLPWFAGSMDGE